MINTLKSIARFYKSGVARKSVLTDENNLIEEIVNHINYNDRFSSSGQPTKHQFSMIREKGYNAIINLVPENVMESPLKNEEKIVTELGMAYTYIPITMFSPTQEDFNAFVNSMENASAKKVWAHCSIGLRASAFIFKYRCTVLEENKEDALWDLREVWEPVGAWKKFCEI